MTGEKDIPGVEIGARIQKLRLAAGLSYDKFADRTGITTSYLLAVENGSSSPTYEEILQFCRVFESRPAVLTDGLVEVGPTVRRLKEEMEMRGWTGGTRYRVGGIYKR